MPGAASLEFSLTFSVRIDRGDRTSWLLPVLAQRFHRRGAPTRRLTSADRKFAAERQIDACDPYDIGRGMWYPKVDAGAKLRDLCSQTADT